MAAADLILLLHSHMPYVRRNGDWPVGEEWLLEAWAESYLPIWRTIKDLTAGMLPGKLALTMTPVLAEQLQDGYMEERLDWYLKNKISHTLLEMERLERMADGPRRGLASFFGDFYRGLLRDFEERFRGRMMKTLADGMDAGAVEVLASAATHAHLPSLGSDVNRTAQIEIGLESYRRCFGRDPQGFWLPECSYTPDLDGVLATFSPPLTYAVLDFSAAQGETRTWQPHRLGSTPLLAIMRDEAAHVPVWTMRGYPAGDDYREFAKRDHDGYGFQYWRITSKDIPLDEKDIYYPDRAAALAKADARDFATRLRLRQEEISASALPVGAPSVILAAYDTELMGHWWREGPVWLREVLGLLGGETFLPREVMAEVDAREVPIISPPMTAWNVDGTFSTWVNQDTKDMWGKTHHTEEDFARRILSDGEGKGAGQALVQAAREMLLMESSDWTFMVTRDAAAGYARERFASHLSRYDAVTGMLGHEEFDAGLLSEIEDTDNLFPWLDLRYWK
jgi:1,4-alpha-glucan branching enzyme